MNFHQFQKCNLFSDASRNNKKQLIITPLTFAIGLILTSPVQSKEIFNIHALEIDDQAASAKDLSQFESGNQAPGIYHVDVYVNNDIVDTSEIEFIADENGELIPKLTLEQYVKYGLNIKTIPSLATVDMHQPLLPLEKFVPLAETKLDFGQQKLFLSIPQANMSRVAQGAVDPALWDEGIPAFIANYSFSGSNNWQEDENSSRNDSYFLNLRTGLNVGGWRVRNYSTWDYSNNNSSELDESESTSSVSHWNSINTYAQHDVKLLKSQFIAGDSYTPSDIFDSIQFRGAQLYSDDNMLPDSLKGFAPTVKGIASSNAQVTVRQNDNIIYQTYVPPGAFTINDLYPTSSSGDLRVTVKEADGSEHSFTQPFSNVPVMQREGRAKYSITAGKYKTQSSGEDEPLFGQGSLIYGLPHDITVYGGMQLSEDYSSYAGGVGIGLGDLGSISLDATQAYTKFDKNDKEGQSYRFQYSKDIEATDSTVTLAGYRYSTEGFYTFSDALDENAYEDGNYSNDLQYNKRSKIQINLTQSIMDGEWGSVSLSGYQQDYWGEDGYERNYNVSYNNSVGGISWSLMYSYTQSPGYVDQNEQQYSLNISIPLSKWLSNAYATTNFNSDKDGHTYTQAGLSGTALEDNNLSYSISEGYDSQNSGNSGMISGDYKGTYGEVNAGYNYNQSAKQINYGMQGSLFVHPYGLTLSQPVSESAAMALIRAPGAEHIKVLNNTGVWTDWRGYTVVPYLSPYRRSRVALDPTSMSDNVDMDSNVQSVVPTSGALVLADFKTKIGYQILVNLTKNGKPVPFGTVVSLGDNETGIVGDDGQVYLSGVPEKAHLVARWGKTSNDECHKTFSVNAMSNKSVQQINLSCE